jgi:hypothetical protein
MGALEDLQAEYNCDLLFVECVLFLAVPISPYHDSYLRPPTGLEEITSLPTTLVRFPLPPYREARLVLTSPFQQVNLPTTFVSASSLIPILIQSLILDSLL